MFGKTDGELTTTQIITEFSALIDKLLKSNDTAMKVIQAQFEGVQKEKQDIMDRLMAKNHQEYMIGRAGEAESKAYGEKLAEQDTSPMYGSKDSDVPDEELVGTITG